MADDSASVDLLTLEDFNKTLSARLSEVESVMAKLDTSGQAPALGGFDDGVRNARRYQDMHRQFVERVGRLHTAILAAQDATATIIAGYRDNESRGRARAEDIASQLSGVTTALDEGQTDGR